MHKNKKRQLGQLARNSERFPLKEINLNKSVNSGLPYRYSDRGKLDQPFGAIVFSPSTASPAYALSLSTTCSTKTTRPLIRTIYEDDSVKVTTPEHNTPVYPRNVAKTDSGTKLVVYSPTTSNYSPDKSQEYIPTPNKVARVLFDQNTQDELETESTDNNLLKQELTFQCDSKKTKDYSTHKYRSQKKVMNNTSAKDAVKKAATLSVPLPLASISESSVFLSDQIIWEWCHLIAHRFKDYKLYSNKKDKFEPQSPENLTAASKDANTKMLVFEEAANYLLNALSKEFSIKVISSCKKIPNSQNVTTGSILQKMSILFKGKSILNLQQSIPHDFGLENSDTKQLAGIKDIYCLLGFITHRLTEALGFNPLENNKKTKLIK